MSINPKTWSLVRDFRLTNSRGILAVLALPLFAVSWALFNVWRVAFRQADRVARDVLVLSLGATPPWGGLGFLAGKTGRTHRSPGESGSGTAGTGFFGVRLTEMKVGKQHVEFEPPLRVELEQHVTQEVTIRIELTSSYEVSCMN